MDNVKKMDLFDIASDLDCICITLDEACDALDILHDNMEDEGFQRDDDSFEEWKAINFVHRFSLYLSTYRVIHRDLENTVSILKRQTEQIYEVYKAQKREAAQQGGYKTA